jgi:hypothetical protein
MRKTDVIFHVTSPPLQVQVIDVKKRRPARARVPDAALAKFRGKREEKRVRAQWYKWFTELK